MIDFLFGVLFQGILVAIFYWPGWLVLRAITIGRYPPPKGTANNEEFVAACGLASFIATIGFIYA